MDPNEYRRAYDASIDLVDGERAIISTINTDALDRFKTVIVPSGAKLQKYRLNPVVLSNHDGKRIPIGKNLWIKVQKDRLIAKTQFLPAGVDELADKIFALYQGGFLNAWSVFFDPIEWGLPTSAELRARPDWAGAKAIYRKWDLLEYSAVTVPGNSEAITEACSRGLALPGWPEPSAVPAVRVPELPELVGRTLGHVGESMRGRAIAEARAAGHLERIVRDARELARGMV